MNENQTLTRSCTQNESTRISELHSVPVFVLYLTLDYDRMWVIKSMRGSRTTRIQLCRYATNFWSCPSWRSLANMASILDWTHP
jgi:hypothetical protein